MPWRSSARLASIENSMKPRTKAMVSFRLRASSPGSTTSAFATPRARSTEDERIYSVCRSEAHTSELKSLMRISYDVFCLKKQKHTNKLLKTIHYYNHSHTTTN